MPNSKSVVHLPLVDFGEGSSSSCSCCCDRRKTKSTPYPSDLAHTDGLGLEYDKN